MSERTVLITGATGHQGGAVTRALANKGFRLRAMTRKPDSEAAGRVRSIGRTRAQRWLAPPLAGFTTILLLPAALPPA